MPTLCLLAALLGGFSAMLCGCRSSTVLRAQQVQAQLETEREEVQQIPLPVKSTFMKVHNFDSWQNPVLTIGPSMLELSVVQSDIHPAMATVGMFDPVHAHRQQVAISIASLDQHMTAIPQSCWPYGRVVAVEEAQNTPAVVVPAVRRNMELTISKLNDLGFVVYDLSSGKIE
ncbi:MAG: hypothetical protein ACP5E5_13350 [Acidobacteriaceae bacterium]